MAKESIPGHIGKPTATEQKQVNALMESMSDRHVAKMRQPARREPIDRIRAAFAIARRPGLVLVALVIVAIAVGNAARAGQTEAPRRGQTALPSADADRHPVGGRGDDPVLPSLSWQKVATGVGEVSSLAVAGNGDLFYTERRSGLHVALRGAAPRLLGLPAAIRVDSASVVSVALHRDFQRNGLLYMLIERSRADRVEYRVLRATFDRSASSLSGVHTALMLAIESRSDAARPGGGIVHVGSDGRLYVAVGRVRLPCAGGRAIAQDVSVIELDLQGDDALDLQAEIIENPADKRGTSAVAAMLLHPESESLLVGRRRPARPDGVDVLAVPDVARWVEASCGAAPGRLARSRVRALDDSAGGRGMSWPSVRPGDQVSAMEVLRAPMWGGWRNAVAVAFDKGQRIDVLRLDERGRVLRSATLLGKLGFGFRAMVQGSEGLYVATSGKQDGDEIWRIVAR